MKLFIIGLVLAVSTIGQARCLVAVGGPNLNKTAQYQLAMALTQLFWSKPNLDVGVIQVSSLGQAVAQDADYLVLAQQKSVGRVDITFRSLLSNLVYFQESYRDSFAGISSDPQVLKNTIAAIVQKMETDGIPELGSFCYKNK